MVDNTLVSRFQIVSERNKDSVAVSDDSGDINYGDLNEQVSRIGYALRQQGIKHGHRVALLIENSIEYVIAFYAIWKVGGIVVALNPQSTQSELSKILQHSTASCFIVQPQNQINIDALSALDINFITLGDLKTDNSLCWQDALNMGIELSWCDAVPDTPAQIIFTSGTTGNPKGVLLTHGSLYCNTTDITKYLELTEKDSIVNVLPFHYSYGNSVLHTHISVGGKLILKGNLAYPQEITNYLRSENASGFSGVPSTYSLLLKHSDWAKESPNLRYMTQAGGPMGVALTQQLLDASHPETQLFVMYGQTEASARISWLPPEKLADKLGSVGIPLEHVQWQIRNEAGEPVRPGTQGEVYVCGDNIMRGYWQNEAATKAVLINGWLKTGDIGWLDPEGYLFLVGRNNDMIKVGAHRINPLEIEEVIKTIDSVIECAVVGCDDDILGQRLKVLVVGEKSKQQMLEIKRACKEQLPPFKIPRDIEYLTELPKTASGKIKRFLLNNIKDDQNAKDEY